MAHIFQLNSGSAVKQFMLVMMSRLTVFCTNLPSKIITSTDHLSLLSLHTRYPCMVYLTAWQLLYSIHLCTCQGPMTRYFRKKEGFRQKFLQSTTFDIYIWINHMYSNYRVMQNIEKMLQKSIFADIMRRRS